MKEWWFSLSARTQFALAAGVFLSALLFIYFLFWAPLLEQRQTLQAQTAEQQALYQWMLTAAQEVKTLRQQAAAPSSASLLSRIDQNLRQNPLQSVNKRLEPKGDQKTVRVEFTQVNFDQMAVWLSQLQNKTGISATTVSVERLAESGMVKAWLILKADRSDE